MRLLTSLVPTAKLGGKQHSSSVALDPESYSTEEQITYKYTKMPNFIIINYFHIQCNVI